MLRKAVLVEHAVARLVDEDRAEGIRRVLSEEHTLAEFRALWIERDKRRQLIAHLLGDNFNPDYIRDADRIIVMHEGLIAEQGTHDQLMAAGGRYAALYASSQQAGG